MKKRLIFMPLLVCMLPYAANAAIAETDLDMQYRKCKFASPGELLVVTTYTYDRTCYDTGDFGSACYSCTSVSMVSNGVEVVENKGVEARILGTSIICSCNTRSSTAACAAGYYGTGTYSIRDGGTGCTACPENATCAGGNGTTFLCNVGYFANGDACERCPSSGGVYGTTANVGATSRSECFIPAGTAFSDSSGSGVYSDNCYYVE